MAWTDTSLFSAQSESKPISRSVGGGTQALKSTRSQRLPTNVEETLKPDCLLQLFLPLPGDPLLKRAKRQFGHWGWSTSEYIHLSLILSGPLCQA